MIELEVSVECICRELFGYFKFTSMEIKHLREYYKNEKIVDGISPHGLLCSLNSKMLFISDDRTVALAIVDDNFEIVKQINKINDNPFEPVAIANSNDKIYVTDDRYNRIYMFDYDQKLIDSIDTTDDGKPFSHMAYAIQMISSTYVCDYYQ